MSQSRREKRTDSPFEDSKIEVLTRDPAARALVEVQKKETKWFSTATPSEFANSDNPRVKFWDQKRP